MKHINKFQESSCEEKGALALTETYDNASVQLFQNAATRNLCDTDGCHQVRVWYFKNVGIR